MVDSPINLFEKSKKYRKFFADSYDIANSYESIYGDIGEDLVDEVIAEMYIELHNICEMYKKEIEDGN